MKTRMLFGTVISGGLAFAVLSLFGLFQDAVTALEVAAAVFLTGIYLAVFWAGVMGRTRREAARKGNQIIWSEFEREAEKEEALQPAA